MTVDKTNAGWVKSHRESGETLLMMPLTELTESLAPYFELVDLIYQNAFEAIPWGTVLTQLRTYLQANRCMLVVTQGGLEAATLMIRDDGYGAELCDASDGRLAAWSSRTDSSPPFTQHITADDFIDTTRQTGGESRRLGIASSGSDHILNAKCRVDDCTEFRLHITRPCEAPGFSPREKQQYRALLQHFRNSIHVYTRRRRAEMVISFPTKATESTTFGTVVLDLNGSVIRTNHTADAILRENDGLALVGSMLYASSEFENTELQQAIRRVLEISARNLVLAEAMSLRRPSGRMKLELLIRSVSLGKVSVESRWPVATILIRDPERKCSPDVKVVQKLFHLTMAEARLSMLLAEGTDLDKAAMELGVRKNTVRCYLRSIFSKTGVKRQTALVSLLLKSVAYAG